MSEPEVGDVIKIRCGRANHSCCDRSFRRGACRSWGHRGEGRCAAEDGRPPCAEGRALLAARLAYLEARISPEPGQQEAWRTFANAVRASADGLDRVCAEEPLRPGRRQRAAGTDGGARRRHASDVWRSGESLRGHRPCPDACSTRHPVAQYRPVAADPGFLPPAAWRPWLPPRAGDMAAELRPEQAGMQAVPWGPPPF